jgi:hypothetical protein|tara:strand:- start:3197 stop:3505 length:309 start_codon:yes stop_codon:yes gene_type:complete
MEGHQRQVIGTLTVEELYKDRASFSTRVKELVDPDLQNMGFELVSYTVTNIDDDEGTYFPRLFNALYGVQSESTTHSYYQDYKTNASVFSFSSRINCLPLQD